MIYTQEHDKQKLAENISIMRKNALNELTILKSIFN